MDHPLHRRLGRALATLLLAGSVLAGCTASPVPSATGAGTGPTPAAGDPARSAAPPPSSVPIPAALAPIVRGGQPMLVEGTAGFAVAYTKGKATVWVLYDANGHRLDVRQGDADFTPIEGGFFTS